jgi:hypothetical protein
MAKQYASTSAGEGKACGGMGGSKSSSGYKKIMAAKNSKPAGPSEAAGKLSEKTKA